MKLTKEQVEHIASLARLRLTEEEKEKYSGQLSGILEYVEKLSAVDTSGVEPTSQVTGLTNATRDDNHEDLGIAQDLIDCAPDSRDGFVLIPKIFEHK